MSTTGLDLHLKLLTVMDKPAGYRNRVPDRVNGVASLLDQLDHLLHLFRRCRALVNNYLEKSGMMPVALSDPKWSPLRDLPNEPAGG